MRKGKGNFDEMTLRWFGDAGKGEPDDADSEGEPSDADQVPEEDDPEVDELDFSNMDPEELKAAAQKLYINNKKLGKISRERLHEIMKKKDKLKEIQTQEEEQRRKTLEEKEEYKKLYDELKPKYDVLEKDTAKTVTHFEQEFEELKEKLDDQYKKLIPNADVREKIRWIRDFLSIEGDKPSSTTTANTEEKPSVGGSVNPPDSGGASSPQSSESAIADQIRNASSPQELEELLRSFGGSPE